MDLHKTQYEDFENAKTSTFVVIFIWNTITYFKLFLVLVPIKYK